MSKRGFITITEGKNWWNSLKFIRKNWLALDGVWFQSIEDKFRDG